MPETNPILAELSDSDVAKICDAATILSVAPGQEIISEGVECPYLYVLVSGELQVFAGSPIKHLADLFPGELVGEMSFVDHRVSSAIVKAKLPSEVLAIPRARIEALILQDPALGTRFFRGISRLVVRRLRSTIRHLGYNEAPKPGIGVQLDPRVLSLVRKSHSPKQFA